MSALGKRRRKILGLAGQRNVIATIPGNIFYLTNFWGSGLAVVKDDRTVLVTTPLEMQRASDTATETEVVKAETRSGLLTVAARHLSPGQTVADAVVQIRRTKSMSKLFPKARREKDDEEIGRIKAASEKIDSLFALIERRLSPGISEREVAGELMKEAVRGGLSPLGGSASLSPIIVASGENGSYPHAELTERRLKAGEFVTIDLFFRFQGYCSDSTRTFAVKAITHDMRRAYEAVLGAQRAGIEATLPGQSCSALHGVVVRELKRKGLEKYFMHSTGHGVGIDVHELPRIARSSRERFRVADVVTVEPGIYLPNRFGIRIEDTVQVGRKPVVLTRYPTELTSVG